MLSHGQWPTCLFKDTTITDSQRQEMSREKLLSKLMLTIQAFTYSSCCESVEAKRMFGRILSEAERASITSKFGAVDIACDGHLLIMPRASADKDDGLQPFSGRFGRLRYFGLAAMAAAGAVAADLVQLVVPFPTASLLGETFGCLRCPIVYPILFGHVLTHVTAAICATCGRTRARSDGLDMLSPIPCCGLDITGMPAEAKSDDLIDDCMGFVKLGLLARILQVMLGALQLPTIGVDSREFIQRLHNICEGLIKQCAPSQMVWIYTCTKLLSIATSGDDDVNAFEREKRSRVTSFTEADLRQSCGLAHAAAREYLGEMGTILQLLVPGWSLASDAEANCKSTFERLLRLFRIESLDEMISSTFVKPVVSHWYDVACTHAQQIFRGQDASEADERSALRRRLFRTQGYRHFDWPLGGFDENTGDLAKDNMNFSEPNVVDQTIPMQLEVPSPQRPTADRVRKDETTVVTFSSKKTAPLLGGFSPLMTKPYARPRVSVVPTSYTDLYAELGSLLPNCEQIAVCLVCGEVLNAGGRGECTKHSYECGAGAGMFFLLQECSGLIMHKTKAAYVHSPYVDSHGETPQFRGRPLYLDLVRYEHLREVWMGHGVRQMVVAERSHNRQVILNDFY